MKRIRVVLAAVFGFAALFGLAGCGAVSDASYAAVRDSAQRALSATFSFSADVANWLEAAPDCRRCPELPGPTETDTEAWGLSRASHKEVA
jgi:hypothetical protein